MNKINNIILIYKMISYINALRIYNKDKPKWCIPRKGTTGAKRIQEIREGKPVKLEQAKDEPKKKPRKKKEIKEDKKQPKITDVIKKKK